MRLLILSLLLALSVPAGAQVLDAYQGRAQAMDETPAKREPALREALAQVLARVSGASGIAGSGRTGPILARASTLLRSVAYETDTQGRLMLVASFDPAGIEDALKLAGLPVWGVIAGAVENVELQVLAVNSERAYAQVMSTLQGLPMVKALQVRETQGGKLSLYLQVEGGAGRLAGALSVTGALTRENSEGPVLIYRASRS